MRSLTLPLLVLSLASCPQASPAQPSPQAEPASLTLTGDWSVNVEVRLPDRVVRSRVEIPPATLLAVTNETHASLPPFRPNAGGWVKGAQLKELRAQETTTPFLLDPASLTVRSSPDPDALTFVIGQDYEADLSWGTVGRKPDGRIAENQPVSVSYRYAPLRLDSVVLAPEGTIRLRPGQPAAAAPKPPTLAPGERRLANIWIPGRVQRLEPRHLFPILESAYPAPPPANPSIADRLLPRTLERLRLGQPLRILAWGDSVTDGSYLPNPARDRWQHQFVARLQQRFPNASIELITEAWGGRNTGSYLAEPPGSPHNYQEKVLAPKPHLVVSEFVNDAGLGADAVHSHYARFRDDFRAIGAEWIILTPHYVRPDWMGIDRERDVDDDPRPYVAGLRSFGETNAIAIADAARRYGRLWRQGIPYTTLMLNSINHPDADGMAIFADALMELFPNP